MAKLGLVLVGLGGSIGSTVTAGLALMRRQLCPRLGMLTETAKVRFADGSVSSLLDHLGSASIDDIIVAGWDIEDRSVLESARVAGVVPSTLLESVASELSEVRPLPAVFSNEFVKHIGGAHTSRARSLFDAAELLRQDLRDLAFLLGTDRLVMVNVASTESTADVRELPVLNDPDAFVRGMRDSHPAISPAMVYFYAAIMEGVPHVNFTPSQAEVPALRRLADERKVLFAGRDGKTGQTLLKTVLAPAFRARQLKVDGWFSTNILGNNDGKVLSNPASLSSKLKTKHAVLDDILGYQVGHEYGTSSHVVAIHYYPPRGDEKEAWDSIDIRGFMGLPMQLKLNFLCRDSVLAAPLVLDLARLTRHGADHGHCGIFRAASSFFKLPLHETDERPIHDFFQQRDLLTNYIVGRHSTQMVDVG